MNKHLNIALSPLKLSPNNHRAAKAKKAEVKEVSVLANLTNKKSIKGESVISQYQPEDEAMLLKAALHNPNKRSIEFSGNSSQPDTKLDISNEADQKLAHPDIVEYEL